MNAVKNKAQVYYWEGNKNYLFLPDGREFDLKLIRKLILLNNIHRSLDLSSLESSLDVRDREI